LQERATERPGDRRTPAAARAQESAWSAEARRQAPRVWCSWATVPAFPPADRAVKWRHSLQWRRWPPASDQL